MKFAVMALLAGSTSAYATIEPHEHEFMQFIAKYSRSYGTKEEYNFRLGVFKKTYEEVQRLNSSQSSSVHAINQFADLTEHEMNARYFGLIPLDETTPKTTPSIGDRPPSKDWRTAGHVGPIKDQQQCGSCWTFTVVGAVESSDSIAGWGLNNYSEQHLLDCDTVGQLGCQGGYQGRGFNWVKNHQLDYTSNYRYTGVQADSCPRVGFSGYSQLDGYSMLTTTEDANLDAIAAGPTSVAVSAGFLPFTTYSSGIFNNPGCSETDLNHGLVAVGYGTEGTQTYIIAKNSWGSSWGESGYIRLATDGEYGVCNWAKQSYSVYSKKPPADKALE